LPVGNWTYSVYGLVLTSDQPIEELWPCEPGPPSLFVRWVEEELVPDGSVWFREWDDTGSPSLRVARADGRYLLQFPGKAGFRVSSDGREVECRPEAGIPHYTVRHLLLNQVLPLVLSRQRVPVFHGSCVDLGSGAAVFAGATGRGKSTLSGFFARCGYPLVTDDCVALVPTEAGFAVSPSYPGVRLWKDSLEFLNGDETTCPPVAHDKTKRHFAGGVMSSSTRPVPLRRFYCLDRSEGNTIEITRLEGAALIREVVSSQFLLDSGDPRELETSFRTACRIAETGSCYRLVVPRGFDRLPEVADTISRHAQRSFQ